jgi:hypothetical protein
VAVDQPFDIGRHKGLSILGGPHEVVVQLAVGHGERLSPDAAMASAGIDRMSNRLTNAQQSIKLSDAHRLGMNARANGYLGTKIR